MHKQAEPGRAKEVSCVLRKKVNDSVTKEQPGGCQYGLFLDLAPIWRRLFEESPKKAPKNLTSPQLKEKKHIASINAAYANEPT